MTTLNETHDPALRSWVASANAAGCDFPIQNLPFGRFRRARQRCEPGASASRSATRCSTCRGASAALDRHATTLNALMAAAPAAARGGAARRDVRRACAKAATKQSAGRRPGAAGAGRVRACPAASATTPTSTPASTTRPRSASCSARTTRCCRTTSGCRSATTGAPRRSCVSGQPVQAPAGQTKAPDAGAPSFGPAQRLDYELELGFFVGPGNALRRADRASTRPRQHLFGVCLLNDWSARDIQAWEYQPLGPFLAKNFAHHAVAVDRDDGGAGAVPRAVRSGRPATRSRCPTSIRRPTASAARSTSSSRSGCRPPQMRAAGEAPVRLTRSSDARRPPTGPRRSWSRTTRSTAATCSRATCSARARCRAPRPTQAGSLLELTHGGKQPITLPNGETRTFLEDGDTLILRGHCERAGAVRIGFGEASGTVLAP